MRIPRRGLITALALVVIGVGGGIAAVTANASVGGGATTIPIGKTVTGTATYYNDAGYGACGRSIDASSQMLVAVSYAYWTSANPNNDPLCSGISVRVTYNGKTITVPVEDKCPSCDAQHIDLSQPAFARLDDLDLGVLKGLTWSFVRTGADAGGAGSGGSAGSGPAHPPATASPTAGGSGSGGSGSGGSGSGLTINVMMTGYGWWDNTPPGSAEISNPVLHTSAGGTGSYADPITAAVPYHCADGCLQWPAGTRFYLPSLQRYVMVEDTCGDNGPDSCPDSSGDHLDVWVGGRSLSHSASDACEERITGTTSAILSPRADLPVTSGDICR